jgi:hypothetical protein
MVNIGMIIIEAMAITIPGNEGIGISPCCLNLHIKTKRDGDSIMLSSPTKAILCAARPNVSDATASIML